ncbi:muts domain V-domain-containing protein [Mycena alexandri]|uniref:Muts domain V-domain-containing protein n=1 Tax=Mycena alexandri TaxID=1745969 RepID=A0AAD6TCI0_9AGAR|nr:muts domain V-domain-containing protein [Mycena alexandri]
MLAARYAARLAARLPCRGGFHVAAPSRAVTKTKKAYADLPNGHLRPDGTFAPPLEEWWAGDEGRSARSPIIVREQEQEVGAKDASEGVEPPPPTKRRGTKKAAEEEDASEKAAEPVDGDDAPVPKKRSRKKTAEPVEDDDAPPRPKRVRKKPTDDATPVKKPRKRPRPDPHAEGGQAPKGSLPREVQDNLERFPHCILLTRVGKFYESYFSQAYEVSRLLNIKLAHRKWDGRSIPFCGFPLQHIDKYLKVLVQQQRRFVALCEEFPRFSASGVVAFDRRVARVVTPGTLIDESFLNQYENNYLLAISQRADAAEVGLAWIDVSTGEFYSKAATYDVLRDEVARIGPREIVLDKALELQKPAQLERVLAEEVHCVSYITPFADEENAHVESTALDDAPVRSDSAEVEQYHPENTLSTTPVDDVTEDTTRFPSLSEFTAHERAAITLLTTYLHANLLDHMPKLTVPAREGSATRMQIDSHTIKALEIRESIREGGVKGSLLSVVKRTSTTSGTRLLARWLCSPSTSIPEISARQALVAFFHDRDHFRADLVAAIASAEDAGRIVQRFLLGRGDAGDLHAVNSTIHVWAALKARILQERQQEALEAAERQVAFEDAQWTSLDALMARMSDLQELSHRIGAALKKRDPGKDVSAGVDSDDVDSEASIGSDMPRAAWKVGNNNWAIKPEFSEKLMSLHAILEELVKRREQLEADLQLRYDAVSLTLRSSPAHGMHVHLLKAKRDQKKINQNPEFVSIAESGTTKCYFYQEWAQLGAQIIETTQALVTAEKEAFESLRMDVNGHAPQLRRNARILDELDVTLGFANLAKEMNFVRPVLTEDPIYDVTDGRHPTVELGLLTNGRVFTPNTVKLTPNSRLHIITGPNMAGKSTLLRQTALIAVLAQTGSFVPAESATLGIVDKLFSRVGAKDDLFHDRSTFMVEMLETAEILQRATPQSLVIMDEVGRGTTVKDGLAIAFATVHHLVAESRCRALFATHFHEVTDMLGYSMDTPAGGIFSNIGFFCTDVDETDDGHFAYSYRIRPGVNRDSHGLKVAQLAGMPETAVIVARDALTWLKSRKEDPSSSAAELNSLGQSLLTGVRGL